MLVSQRSAYDLQQKLRLLDEEEAMEIDRFSHPHIMNPYDEMYDYFATMRLGIMVVFSKRRQRAIWWAQYKNDVIAGCIVAAVIGLCVYFVVG